MPRWRGIRRVGPATVDHFHPETDPSLGGIENSSWGKFNAFPASSFYTYLGALVVVVWQCGEWEDLQEIGKWYWIKNLWEAWYHWGQTMWKVLPHDITYPSPIKDRAPYNLPNWHPVAFCIEVNVASWSAVGLTIWWHNEDLKKCIRTAKQEESVLKCGNIILFSCWLQNWCWPMRVLIGVYI